MTSKENTNLKYNDSNSPRNWTRVRYNDSVNEINYLRRVVIMTSNFIFPCAFCVSEIFEPKMLIEVRDYLISSGNFFGMYYTRA